MYCLYICAHKTTQMYRLFKPLLFTFLITALSATQACGQAAPLDGAAERIMFYNTENLFDTIDDPLTDDKEFLPSGKMNWTADKYNTKLAHITQVVEAGGFPILVGLCEVENKSVLNDLVKQPALAAKDYAFIHFDSPDERGIDVALIYQSSKFKVLASKSIPIVFDKEPDDKTRDILYVKGEVNGEVIHVFVNHWPSRSEGVEKTAPRRHNAANAVRIAVDSIFAVDKDAQIIIMGDLNDHPEDLSLTFWLKALPSDSKKTDNSLYNLADVFAKQGKGTHKYKGEWGTLDQIIVSRALFDKKGLYTKTDAAKVGEFDFLLSDDPKGGKWTNRTYAGDKYLGGYSDHLPVYLNLYLGKK